MAGKPSNGAVGRMVVLHADPKNASVTLGETSYRYAENPAFTSPTTYENTWDFASSNGLTGSTQFEPNLDFEVIGFQDISSVGFSNEAYPLWRAFDKLMRGLAERTLLLPPGAAEREGTPVQWIGLKYPTPVALREVSFTVGIHGNEVTRTDRTLAEWSIEGSSDGINWQPVQSYVEDYVDTPLPLLDVFYTFAVAGGKAYTHWRLLPIRVIQVNNSGLVQIAELIFRVSSPVSDATFALDEQVVAMHPNGYPLDRPLHVALVKQHGIPDDRIIAIDLPTENQFAHPSKPGGVLALAKRSRRPVYTRTNFSQLSALRVRVLKADGELDDELLEPYVLALHFV